MSHYIYIIIPFDILSVRRVNEIIYCHRNSITDHILICCLHWACGWLWLIWITWILLSTVRKRPLNLITHSLWMTAEFESNICDNTCIVNSTHWGWEMHICISEHVNIGSDNGLSPGRRQAIIWSNAGILLIGPLGTNFSEILIGIYTFSLKKTHLNRSSGKWQPFCLGLNVLTYWACFLSMAEQCLPCWKMLTYVSSSLIAYDLIVLEREKRVH